MKQGMGLTEAKMAGLKSYTTGKPCKRGHLAPRLTANGACSACESIRKGRWDRTEAGRASCRRSGSKYASKIPNLETLSDDEYKAELRRRKYWRRDRLPDPTRPMAFECEICGKTARENGKALTLDHCHETNTFRGWLCDHCNRGLGFLGDSLSGIKNALKYLEAWAASQNYGETK